MLEGYSDFILKSSVFGGKSLLAIKGRQQTKLGLSSDYSVIRAETRLDKNNDGKFLNDIFVWIHHRVKPENSLFDNKNDVNVTFYEFQSIKV